MNPILRRLSSSLPFLRLPNPYAPLSSQTIPPGMTGAAAAHQRQWSRGIRVRVHNGNLEQALVVMERKMKSSGMERLIKRQVTHHIKNSEKRVLARKKLELRVRSQELARKLQSILVKKIRGL